MKRSEDKEKNEEKGKKRGVGEGAKKRGRVFITGGRPSPCSHFPLTHLLLPPSFISSFPVHQDACHPFPHYSCTHLCRRQRRRGRSREKNERMQSMRPLFVCASKEMPTPSCPLLLTNLQNSCWCDSPIVVESRGEGFQ